MCWVAARTRSDDAARGKERQIGRLTTHQLREQLANEQLRTLEFEIAIRDPDHSGSALQQRAAQVP